MSETKTSTHPEENQASRQAVLVAQNIGANNLLFIFLGIYLVITTGTWQAYGVIALAAEAVIGGFVSASLIKQGRSRLGAQVLLITDCIAPALASWIIADFSFVSIGYIAVSTYFIYIFVIPEDKKRAALATIAVAIIIPTTTLFVDVPLQLVSPVMLIVAPILTAVLGAVFLGIIIRQALNSRNIRNKLLVPTLIFISLVIGAIVAYNTFTTVQQFDASEEERLEIMHETFLARVKAEEDLAVALAIDTAQNVEAAKAFAERDRERLTLLTYPVYLELDTRFSIPQHQFHLEPATSFLRLHNVESFGDDLSSFRFTVLEANEEKRVISGIEVGRGGIGIRGVSPVKYLGQHVGSVEFGLNLDKLLLETLKDEYGFDFQIGISKEAAEIVTLIASERFENFQSENIFLQASTLETPFLVGDDIYAQALQGTGIFEQQTINDREYTIHTVPIVDFSGNTIGTLDIISDRTEVVEARNRQIILSIGILLAGLLVAGVGFTLISNRTLQPIGALTTAANAIAAGDFTQKANVQSEDELGTLAVAFNTMSDQIQENVRTLEDRVAERTKDQTTVAQIATEISTIQEMQEMLAHMVHLTQRGFGLYHAHVFTFHEEDEREELRIIACGYREGDEHEGTHGTTTIAYDRPDSIVARCARERKPVIVNDVRSSPDWLPNPLLPETRSEMALPLIVGDRLLGILDVQSEFVDHFTSDDEVIQSTLAAQVAVAMQNLIQFEESQKLASDLSVVAEVGIATATTLETDVLLQDIVDLSKKSFELYHAHIYLLNEAGDTLELASGAGEVGRQMVQEGLSIPLNREQSLVARAARTRQGVTVNDVTEDPNFLPNPLLPDTRAELAVPLIAGDQVLGVLDVQSERVGRFTQLDVNINTTLASQIAVALQNTRSFENARKQAERETKINLIAQKIQQADTIEKAMQVAARELGNALGKRRTMVALDPEALSGQKKKDA